MNDSVPPDLVELLAELVAVDTTNPSLVPGAPGEEALTRLLAGRLAALGLSVDTWDAAPGRPNVVARLPGSGGGRSLALVGHLDTAGSAGGRSGPAVREGRLYGRGAADMKGGLAAMVAAAERLAARAASGQPLRGDLLVASVVDAQWESLGATALLERYRPDAAVLAEASGLDVVTEHGGFAWFEVESRGVEASGLDAADGIDAIALLGPVLDGVRHLDRALARKTTTAYGRPNVHTATIAGGVAYPAYAAACTLGIERRLVPGETVGDAEAELHSIIEAARETDSRFRGSVRTVVGHDPVRVDPHEPVVAALIAAANEELGRPVTVRGELAWMDSGILALGGVPCVVFGPVGGLERTADEWVHLETVATSARVYARLAERFCV